jgi:hypothetical protein
MSDREKPGTEYHYLLWFAENADFGPAHSDVIDRMDRRYRAEFGSLPTGWNHCNGCGEEPDVCTCRKNWKKP